MKPIYTNIHITIAAYNSSYFSKWIKNLEILILILEITIKHCVVHDFHLRYWFLLHLNMKKKESENTNTFERKYFCAHYSTFFYYNRTCFSYFFFGNGKPNEIRIPFNSYIDSMATTVPFLQYTLRRKKNRIETRNCSNISTKVHSM